MRVLSLAAMLGAALSVGAQAETWSPESGDDGARGARLDRVFRAEAGRWLGECRERNPDGPDAWLSFDADFTITHDAKVPHAFEGRYGDYAMSGTEIIADGRRQGVLHTADGESPLDTLILEARFDDPTSYAYREASGSAPRLISTVTRVGDMQFNTQYREGGSDLAPVTRFCVYRKAS